jgi:DegV family protein with EDD domain
MQPETLNKWGVKYVELSFIFEGQDETYLNYSLASKDFYDRMRNGDVAKTSAVNVDAFKSAFSEELKKGNDVLYLGFSGGLSGTFNASRIAAEELSEEYPERKVLVVDTLSASAGFGMLLFLTVEEKNKGADIETAAKFAEDSKLCISHWFTVDDLVYLKRGGRISAATALVGGLLGIKPVLHMDNEGHLINVTKVRGRKAAIKALADKFGETAISNTEGPVFISHGDCMEDAQYLKSYIYENYGVQVGIIADVGPVIGAHSGPGTLALFFKAKVR